jgi:hypothetical protein
MRCVPVSHKTRLSLEAQACTVPRVLRACVEGTSAGARRGRAQDLDELVAEAAA